jgi:hypothetical protein
MPRHSAAPSAAPRPQTHCYHTLFIFCFFLTPTVFISFYLQVVFFGAESRWSNLNPRGRLSKSLVMHLTIQWGQHSQFLTMWSACKYGAMLSRARDSAVPVLCSLWCSAGRKALLIKRKASTVANSPAESHSRQLARKPAQSPTRP